MKKTSAQKCSPWTPASGSGWFIWFLWRVVTKKSGVV